MQGSFSVEKFQKIVDRNVNETSEMFFRETVGNKTKLFSSDTSTNVKSENGTRESGSRDRSPSLSHSGYSENTSDDLIVRNKHMDKEYVHLVSGFVTFKDFSKLWSPALPFVFEGVNMHAILKHAVQDLLKNALEETETGNEEDGVDTATERELISSDRVSRFQESLIHLWEKILATQEHLMDYGVSETVKAGETRVIHRLYDSGIFLFIYNDSNILERVRKYLRRSDLTRTMFSETVGLYLCWNGVTMNNRSTINEQKTMLNQFHTSFQIFARFVQSRELKIRSEIEDTTNILLVQ